MRRPDPRPGQIAPQRKAEPGFPHLVAVPSSQAKKDEKRILVINGHPDPRPERYCAALARAYLQGARKSGWDARELTIGAIAHDDCGAALHSALDATCWAKALVIVFPLWLDAPPAPLRDFFGLVAEGQMTPKPARLIVTMEMPAFAHRRKYCANGASSNSLSLPGIAGALSFIGSVNAINAMQRAEWLTRLEELGTRGE